MEKNPHISVVSPVYRAEAIVEELVKQVKQAISSITEDFEIILVNDYSPDNSWQKISEECDKDSRVKGINLSRNFGQHNAIGAGLDCAQGEWVVVMDCDLQDKPEEIISLYNKAQEGFDVVFAKRFNRYDSYFKVKTSYFFSKLFNYFTGCNHDSAIANFSIISKDVVEAYRLLKEKNRDYTLLINWLGFNQGTIDVDHDRRFEGESTYNLKKLLILAFNDIIANTNKPLNLSINFGFIIALISFLSGLFLVLGRIFGFFTVEGWTSIVVSIWLVCGLLMMCIGTSSIYIGKIFEESKSRPNYVIKNKINI
jgi:polyisoprenyl-phosphate glycosyltransferase